MILDLHDPPVDPPEDSQPRLWLVPRGPAVHFKRLRDPDIPWHVRLTGGLIGLLISGLAVLGIVAFATLVKSLYDRVDEQDRDRALRLRQQQEEAAAQNPQNAPEGTIPLSLAPRPPADEKPGGQEAGDGSKAVPLKVSAEPETPPPSP